MNKWNKVTMHLHITSPPTNVMYCYTEVILLVCEYINVCSYLLGISRWLSTGWREVLGVLVAEMGPVAAGGTSDTRDSGGVSAGCGRGSSGS